MRNSKSPQRSPIRFWTGVPVRHKRRRARSARVARAVAVVAHASAAEIACASSRTTCAQVPALSQLIASVRKLDFAHPVPRKGGKRGDIAPQELVRSDDEPSAISHVRKTCQA